MGCHALLQGNLPKPGIKPTSLPFLHWQAASLPLAPPKHFLYGDSFTPRSAFKEGRILTPLHKIWKHLLSQDDSCVVNVILTLVFPLPCLASLTPGEACEVSPPG